MVAKKIKEYLDEKGIKQRAVAEKAGMTDQEISQYLNGRVRLSADKFFLICDVLGESPERFKP